MSVRIRRVLIARLPWQHLLINHDSQTQLLMLFMQNVVLTKVPFWQITPAIELVSWIATVLVPTLRLINGTPVTEDQEAIQFTLFSIAAIGAVGLRFYNWSNKYRWHKYLASCEGECDCDLP